MRRAVAARWRALPAPMRKSVVLTIGITLLTIGAALVILPGPFTLPFVIAGIAVLSSEFVWAARLLERGKATAGSTMGWVGRVPTPALIAIVVLLIGAIAAAGYWWFSFR